MADTVIAFPKYGDSSGATVPIRAEDLGDGSYALGISTGAVSGILVAMPTIGNSGAVVAVATVLVAPGIYALKSVEQP